MYRPAHSVAPEVPMVSGAMPGVPEATGISVPAVSSSLRSVSSWVGAAPISSDGSHAWMTRNYLPSR